MSFLSSVPDFLWSLFFSSAEITHCQSFLPTSKPCHLIPQCLVWGCFYSVDNRPYVNLATSITGRKVLFFFFFTFKLFIYLFILKFLILFIYLFIIYFWLRWVFVAACGLSLFVASGGYSSLRCVGFSLWWLLLLQSTGSRSTGFSSCGMWAQ